MYLNYAAFYGQAFPIFCDKEHSHKTGARRDHFLI
jgi:hypothetical protein